VGAAVEVFGTVDALAEHADLLAGVRADEVSAKDAAALSETVTPQGLVAVCLMPAPRLESVLTPSARLVAALVEPNDPGNVGTVIRTADAAGADAVVLVGGVDAFNGKAVRASAGSVLHIPIVTADLAALLAASSAAGLSTLATSGAAADTLDGLVDDGALRRPTLWLFGSEAHGLSADVLAAADRAVRIPIHGRAESLNLAAAAAVCLYASARAQRDR
jgi:TrmH family RNA methyltransferase